MLARAARAELATLSNSNSSNATCLDSSLLQAASASSIDAFFAFFSTGASERPDISESSELRVANAELEEVGGDVNGIKSLLPCKHMMPIPGMVIRGTVPVPGAFAGALAEVADKTCRTPNAAGTQPTVFLKYAGGLGAMMFTGLWTSRSLYEL